jgi:cell division protein FtsI (penicillin-binding protein 3)
MKPFLFAAAIQEGTITPDTLIDCENGRWKVARRVIRDTHPSRWLPAHKVLRYSSNIGSAKIGMNLGAGVYYDYLTKLGFGEKTHLGLPGESSGILRPPGSWTSVDLACISFGQSIGVTAVQLARAFLCLANQGATRDLNLVLSPREARKNASIQVFTPETAATVLKMMEEVVQEDGTGRSARIEGITMAGKTGTAQKASKEGGYGDQYLSSFVALVPAEKPELMVLTMIDEPQKANYGSMVAAPVCREVTVRTLAYHDQLSETLHATVEDNPTVDELADEPLTRAVPAPVARIDDGKVPDIEGMPVRRALETLVRMGIVPVLKGRGMTVKRQEPRAGQPWPGNRTKEGADDVFVLWLS